MDITGLLNEEQFLLKQRDELYLDKIVIQDNLKEISSKLDNIKSEKEFLKKYKKEVIGRYVNNIAQIICTGAVVDVPFHLLSNSDSNIILSDYIIAGSIIYITGLLTIDLVIQIKDYKKNNNFISKEDILLKQDMLERDLAQNQLYIEDTLEELDSIYEQLLQEDGKTKIKEVR